MTNMDPLEYFSRFLGIPEIIFKHLNGKDVLVASEVSPNYYNFIASSNLLMKKIKVAFKEKQTLHQEDFDMLKNSSRQYQSIHVCMDSVYEERLSSSGEAKKTKQFDFFLNNSRSWKNVEVSYNIGFAMNLPDAHDFFASIESSVESLSVINQNDDFQSSFHDASSEFESFKVLQFPKLKQLKLHLFADSYLDQAYARFFLNSIAIEKLEFHEGFSHPEGGVLKKLLQNFDKVTNLNIKVKTINQVFRGEHWKQFQVKLKSLSIIVAKGPAFSTNFRNFLKSQSDHLEELDVAVIECDKQAFDVIMKMSKLKSLCLRRFYTLPEDFVYGFSNEVSNSITDLKFQYPITTDFLKPFLELMPNVKRLTLESITDLIIESLISLERKFEELRVLAPTRFDTKKCEKFCITKTGKFVIEK